ncbi:MAG: DUF721 domain-containing protein [Magnetococcales bacterium]|nr:DUF721 domain-containing protein [Magnetococcales bacterium]
MDNKYQDSGYTPVATVIQHIAGRLLDQPRSKAHKLRWEWCQVVGPQVAQHSEPARLSNGVLTVRVDSPVWNSQLHHLKGELLEKMQCRLPSGTVRELRFRQGTLHGVVETAKATPEPWPEPCLEDQQRATELVAAVVDPELRAVLRSIVLNHMTRVRHEKADL